MALMRKGRTALVVLVWLFPCGWLSIADAGNARILSVKLDYHVTERLPLKAVPDQGRARP
jgi:hypothetical protein